VKAGAARWGIAFSCGVVAAVLTLVTLGGLTTPPGWHDEAAYLLQAKLFAQGKWAVPSPPLPEFFEQLHVLMVPKLAAKYPPGQALFLSPGVAVGLPGLMVALGAGVTAAWLYMLVRARWNRVTGLGAVLFWLVSPMALYWRSSYLSEVTTSMLWLMGLLLAAEWWRRGGTRLSTALGAVVGVMAITRPLTALAFAIPLAAICIHRAMERHRMRDGMAALLAVIAIVAVLPVWALRTTGRITRPPVSLYTAQYMPWDRMGFGLDPTLATRQGPPDMAKWSESFRDLHAHYTPRASLGTVEKRIAFVARDAFGRWWPLFACFVAVGCVALGRAGALVGAQAGALFALYAIYAHFVTWDVYYLELVAPACGCAAVGLAFLIRALARRRAWTPSWYNRFLLATFVVLGTLLFAEALVAAVQSVTRHDRQRHFLALVAGINQKAIVFVTYGASHDVDAQFVGLLGPPGPTWVVHDLGARNSCLAAQESGRQTFRFDEDAARLYRVTLPTDSAVLRQLGCS